MQPWVKFKARRSKRKQDNRSEGTDRKSCERTYEEAKEDQKERGSKGTRWEVGIAVVLSERGKRGRNPSEEKE